MTSRILFLCAIALMAERGFATAQDFDAKASAINIKANALIEKANKIIPPKVADNLKELAEARGLSENLLQAFLKAGGFFDPKFDGTQSSVVPDIAKLSEKDRVLIASKYMLAEKVLAWRKVDPKFDYFFSSMEKENHAVYIKLLRTQLESAIESLEYAKKRPVFAGLEYAAGGPEVVDELKAVLKRVPK